MRARQPPCKTAKVEIQYVSTLGNQATTGKHVEADKFQISTFCTNINI